MTDSNEISESLVEMFRHNVWANERLFEACEGLSESQLDTSVVGVYGNIRETLMHIVGAQERYVTALAETESAAMSREKVPFPGVATLRKHALESGKELTTLAARARSGSTVTTTWHGEEHTLPVWLLCVQAINHATEHRAQVAAVLTFLGIEPPSLDGWTYHETRFNSDWSMLWSS